VKPIEVSIKFLGSLVGATAYVGVCIVVLYLPFFHDAIPPQGLLQGAAVVGWYVMTGMLLTMGVVSLVVSLRMARRAFRFSDDKIETVVRGPEPRVLSSVRRNAVQEVFALGHYRIGLVVGDMLVILSSIGWRGAATLVSAIEERWGIRVTRLSEGKDILRSLIRAFPYDKRGYINLVHSRARIGEAPDGSEA